MDDWCRPQFGNEQQLLVLVVGGVAERVITFFF